jgi:hypothetical protein
MPDGFRHNGEFLILKMSDCNENFSAKATEISHRPPHPQPGRGENFSAPTPHTPASGRRNQAKMVLILLFFLLLSRSAKI